MGAPKNFLEDWLASLVFAPNGAFGKVFYRNFPTFTLTALRSEFSRRVFLEFPPKPANGT